MGGSSGERRIGRRRLRPRVTPAWVFVYLLMILLVAFTALPLVYVASTAFKPLDELYLFPPRFFVRHPTARNFADLMTSLSSSVVPFSRYLVNSVVITAAVVVATVIVSSMAAYSIVKFRPPGSRALFSLAIAALMFSSHVTEIPRYMVVNAMGLINTTAALVLPRIAVAYNLFLMKQFTEQIPDELLESARMDGAGEWTVYWRIVMPSLRPAWATLVVFAFVSSWNDYFSPLIYITSQAMQTMPLALQTIAGGPAAASIGRAGAVAAATLLMVLPTVVLFTLMQRMVMETMLHSGIKG
jgi:ABC-type glycerol-3-phosphate transport system permease component